MAVRRRSGRGRSGGRKAQRRPPQTTEITRDVVARLPKSDLHVHLDGSLRLETLIELATERRIELPSRTPSGLLETVFKRAYRSLPEYLRGFEFTVACLQDAEALERAAYELCWDCRNENVFYVEMRFAPQLHAHEGLDLVDVLGAVSKGIRRAEQEINKDPEIVAGALPEFHGGIIVCALRFFLPAFSAYYRTFFTAMPYAPKQHLYGTASVELARAAVRAAEEGDMPVVGFDLAGQERGFPAKDHVEAYQMVHDHFLGKTVHAGEDYGPESIFQAITDCHADRIGHGTWIFSPRKIHDSKITDRRTYIRNLVRYVADRRITLEVCLTSNQQTIPEFRNALHKHPFGRMRRERLSVSLCTDNRLVSRTTVTDEVMKAVETFRLRPRGLKEVLTYGFKRSFFPAAYHVKRAYVKQVLNITERMLLAEGMDLRPSDARGSR